MCAHREAPRLLAIALSPDLPVAVSKRVVLHTGPAYRSAIDVFFADWRDALGRLAKEKVPIKLLADANDDSQIPGLNERLAREYSNITARTVPDAAHIIAITHGRECDASACMIWKPFDSHRRLPRRTHKTKHPYEPESKIRRARVHARDVQKRKGEPRHFRRERADLRGCALAGAQ